MLFLSRCEEDNKLLARVQALMEAEQNMKYRKQYEALLKVK
jgi:hypothetical protein